MTDVYAQDRARILGNVTRDSAIAQRAAADAAIQAAIKIERERQAEQQRQAEARANEAAAIAQAEAESVTRLEKLKPLYQQRQEVARAAIEAVAALARIESEIRAGLSDADRALSSVEVLIEPTQRGAWRQALRDRGGLPSQHIYAPDVQPTTEAQAIGVTVCRGVTSGIIQPGAIAAGRDIVNL